MSRPRTKNKHLPKYVTIIHSAYWYRPPNGKAVRIAKEGDEVALYRFMADNCETISSGGDLTTIGDCFDRYEREIVPTLAPRTQKDYHRHLKVLRAWCGQMRPEELQPRDVGRFLDVTKGKIQRNRQVAVLSAVFSKMKGRWYVTTVNPCEGVERNPSKRRTRYVTDAEYAALHALMPSRIQVAMDLALLTGQRQGDLLRLQWPQVDTKERLVYFQQGKTGKKLAVRVTQEFEDVLVRAKRMVPQLPRLYVIRKEDGRPYTSEGFRAIWQRYIKKAMNGYTKRGMKYEPVLKERFTFHDLRAKNISDSVDIQKAFERAGHTSMAMTRGVYDRGVRKVDPLR